jgi:hypothetical protein
LGDFAIVILSMLLLLCVYGCQKNNY